MSVVSFLRLRLPHLPQMGLSLCFLSVITAAGMTAGASNGHFPMDSRISLCSARGRSAHRRMCRVHGARPACAAAPMQREVSERLQAEQGCRSSLYRLGKVCLLVVCVCVCAAGRLAHLTIWFRVSHVHVVMVSGGCLPYVSARKSSGDGRRRWLMSCSLLLGDFDWGMSRREKSGGAAKAISTAYIYAI